MDRITKAANRMSELLRALLVYSRAGTRQLNHQSVSLTEVVKHAASDLEFVINRAKGSLEISDLPTVDADAALLRQLFQNIIENSIKYRKESEPPVVKIYGSIADTICQVFIEDNGIGFDECYGQKIFKPFERLHGKNSPYDGTGMGLAICKKIVNRHGGDITVRSAPGQGTTFIVILPIKQETVA
jgi:signal transduction histidine kinase